jgi:hypothetical protein
LGAGGGAEQSHGDDDAGGQAAGHAVPSEV